MVNDDLVNFVNKNNPFGSLAEHAESVTRSYLMAMEQKKHDKELGLKRISLDGLVSFVNTGSVLRKVDLPKLKDGVKRSYNQRLKYTFNIVNCGMFLDFLEDMRVNVKSPDFGNSVLAFPDAMYFVSKQSRDYAPNIKPKFNSENYSAAQLVNQLRPKQLYDLGKMVDEIRLSDSATKRSVVSVFSHGSSIGLNFINVVAYDLVEDSSYALAGMTLPQMSYSNENSRKVSENKIKDYPKRQPRETILEEMKARAGAENRRFNITSISPGLIYVSGSESTKNPDLGYNASAEYLIENLSPANMYSLGEMVKRTNITCDHLVLQPRITHDEVYIRGLPHSSGDIRGIVYAVFAK